jgi:hypothetical protein
VLGNVDVNCCTSNLLCQFDTVDRPPADKATTAPDARIEELPNRSDRFGKPPRLRIWNQPSDTARPTGFGSTLRLHQSRNFSHETNLQAELGAAR